MQELFILETERLCIREFTLQDSAFILELLNDPAFILNIADRNVRNTQDAIQYLENGPLASYKKHGFGLYMVELKETRVPIGMCGLIKRETLADVDIGFAFLPSYRKKGFAFESSRALLAYAKNILGLKRLVGITAMANGSSIRVLEGLGMTFEKVIRLNGDDSDTRLYSLSLL